MGKSKPKDIAETQDSPLQNFLIGFLFSGLPIFVYLSLSLEMSHFTLAQIGSLKLAIAIAIPLICGLIAVRLKQPFTQFLTSVLESVNLPF